MSRATWKYEQVRTSTEEDGGVDRERQRQNWARVAGVSAAILGIVMLMGLLGAMITRGAGRAGSDAGQAQSVGQSQSQPKDCGATPDDAKARGCLFDVLTYSWQPPACIDETTSSESREWLNGPDLLYGPWPFFSASSPDDAHRVSDEAALGLRVGQKTWATQEEHLAHCVFMMRRLQRVADGLVPHLQIESRDHVRHCTHEILGALHGVRPATAEGLRTVLTVGITSC